LLAVAVFALVVVITVAAREHLAATSNPPEAAAQRQTSMPATGAGTEIHAATFRRIAEAQTPMVVSIRTQSCREQQLTDSLPPDFFEWFFDRPGGPSGDARPDPDGDIVEGAGSGFIIDASGLILTNNHVVEGARRIDVGLFVEVPPDGGSPPGRSLEAKIVGRDPLTDTALIRLVEKRVNNATEAAAALRSIGPDGVALVLISRDRQETFLTMNPAG
jgi:serine protease Do